MKKQFLLLAVLAALLWAGTGGGGDDNTYEVLPDYHGPAHTEYTWDPNTYEVLPDYTGPAHTGFITTPMTLAWDIEPVAVQKLERYKSRIEAMERWKAERLIR